MKPATTVLFAAFLSLACDASAISLKLRAKLVGHEADLYGLAFSPDGKSLISGDEKGGVWKWDVVAGKGEKLVQLGKNEEVMDLAVSPDGKEAAIAVGGISLRDSRVDRIDLAGGAALPSIEMPNRMATVVLYHPKGSVIATGNDRGEIQFWKREDLAKVAQIDLKNVAGISALLKDKDGPMIVLEHMSFSPDGKQLLTVTMEGLARIWGLPKGDPLGRLIMPNRTEDDENLVNSMAVSPAGKVVAASGTDLVVWDLASRKLLGQCKPGTGEGLAGLVAAISPAGDFVVSSAGGAASKSKKSISNNDVTTLEIWPAANLGKRLFALAEAHGKDLSLIRFSPDGGTLASSDIGGEIRLWDILK